MRKIIAVILAITLLSVNSAICLAGGQAATRIKDIAKVQGVRSNQLVGYGLVVGLTGTGDSNKITYTIDSIVNMMRAFGITISGASLQPKNVAAVMVTAQLPPFVKNGDTIDITVSSIGDAKSLQGGVLLQAPLKAADGAVYAVAQGPLSVGGFTASSGGASQQKNITTVGLVSNGAIVERDVPTTVQNNGNIALSISQPDFTTASRVAQSIDQLFGPIAVARDAGTVEVRVPAAYANNLVSFISDIEELPVRPDNIAKVVVNSRTGTVVMGNNVTIDQVAVAQGGLSVKIGSTTSASQPAPLSGGTTAVTTNKTVDVKEKQANLIMLPASSSVGDVVNALNAVGATPLDVISVLQAIKSAGALHADLELI
jgi:flagellar P-ring protein FlgI